MVKQNNNVLLIALVLIGGLVAGLIGGAIGSGITGDVTLSNNAAGTGTYRIRPEGTYADTWLPWKDGSVYLTSNGKKTGGDIVFRKWTGGTSFSKLATISSDGQLTVNSLDAANTYTKEVVNEMFESLGRCNHMGVSRGSSVQTCEELCTSREEVAMNTELVAYYYYAGDDLNKKRNFFMADWFPIDTNLPQMYLDIEEELSEVFGTDMVLAQSTLGCKCCPNREFYYPTTNQNVSAAKSATTTNLIKPF